MAWARPRGEMSAGPVITGAGLLLLVRATSGDYLTSVLPAVMVFGAGLAITVAPLTSTAMDSAPPRHAGIASGVLTTVIQVGNALGVAFIGIIFFGTLGRGDGYSYAMRASLAYLVVLAVAVAAMLLLLPRPGRGSGGNVGEG